MSKYNDLVSILDKICDEAPAENKRYHEKGNISLIEHARSRAFIHLYLQVKFGIIDFSKREHYITDDANDGGIDAYYIDTDAKILYIIQSKFRNNDVNFESKEISYDELLSMDIERITQGEETNENGVKYNGKIQRFQKEISEISDFARYKFNVILLANIRDSVKAKLVRLVGQYPIQIYNFESVYEQLVFPIISGTYFEPKELRIELEVNRDSAGNRIQYYPQTEYGECTVNALFVPTKEIGRILNTYKNSILKFNPRSYLELQTGSINRKIYHSIVDKTTNEFALFNNGITMLSDETAYKDTVGRKNVAVIYLTDPQIINGGQTAYTLSRIYEEAKQKGDFSVFDNKEVLLKVISFNDEENSSGKRGEEKLRLIEQISTATNQQTPVIEADRRANDKVQVELQQLIYKDYGLYYERKRGEFADGIRNKYVNREQIIDREDFLRCVIALSDPVNARSGTAEKLFRKESFDKILPSVDAYKLYMYAYMIYKKLNTKKLNETKIRQYARYSIVYVVSKTYSSDLSNENTNTLIKEEVDKVANRWEDFEKYAMSTPDNKVFYFKEKVDLQTGEKQIDANWTAYYKGRTLRKDLDTFFQNNR